MLRCATSSNDLIVVLYIYIRSSGAAVVFRELAGRQRDADFGSTREAGRRAGERASALLSVVNR